jgi:hypothetical protein
MALGQLRGPSLGGEAHLGTVLNRRDCRIRRSQIVVMKEETSRLPLSSFVKQRLQLCLHRRSSIRISFSGNRTL